MLTQSFAVLNQMLDTQNEAKSAMIEFSRQFPEVALLQTAPGSASSPPVNLSLICKLRNGFPINVSFGDIVGLE